MNENDQDETAAVMDVGQQPSGIRFSPSTVGFYPFDIDYPSLPDDMIVVTEEEHAAAMSRQSNTVLTVIDGKLAIVPAPPPPPPTAGQVQAQRDALLLAARLRMEPLQDAVELDEATDAEIASLKAWKKYRVDLSRIEQQTGFPASVDWPLAPI